MIQQTIEILWTYRDGFFSGLMVTMQLSGFIWILGMAVGLLLGFLADKFPSSLGYLLRTAAAIFSAIPAIVLLFWAYFPLQILLQVNVDPFWTAAISLTALNAISIADIIRGLLADFPPQFRDAAKVCGLSTSRTFWQIELPLILRQAVPPLLLLQVTMLHLTLFSSLISVEDIFRVAQRINSTIYRPVEIYSAVAVLFLAICLPLQLVASVLQRRLGVILKER